MNNLYQLELIANKYQASFEALLKINDKIRSIFPYIEKGIVPKEKYDPESNTEFKPEYSKYIESLYESPGRSLELALKLSDSMQEHPLALRERMYNMINSRKKKIHKSKHKK